MTSSTRFIFATAIDGNKRLHAELILWVLCTLKNLPQQAFKIVVYMIDFKNQELEEWLLKRGVCVRHRPPPIPGVPHCNRLVAFLDNHDSECIIATDSDLYVVRDPSDLFPDTSLIRAAPNNACNPPGFIFKRVLEEAGFKSNYRPTFTLLPGALGRQETYINNISAGIIALPSSASKYFSQHWLKWAIWLNERKWLLERWVGHIDQISFALACDEINRDVFYLPPQINLILHLLDKVDTIYAIHLSSAHIPDFPGRFNANKTLNPNGLSPEAFPAIESLNACILEAIEEFKHISSIGALGESFMNPLWIRP